MPRKIREPELTETQSTYIEFKQTTDGCYYAACKSGYYPTGVEGDGYQQSPVATFGSRSCYLGKNVVVISTCSIANQISTYRYEIDPYFTFTCYSNKEDTEQITVKVRVEGTEYISDDDSTVTNYKFTSSGSATMPCPGDGSLLSDNMTFTSEYSNSHYAWYAPTYKIYSSSNDAEVVQGETSDCAIISEDALCTSDISKTGYYGAHKCSEWSGYKTASQCQSAYERFYTDNPDCSGSTTGKCNANGWLNCCLDCNGLSI